MFLSLIVTCVSRDARVNCQNAGEDQEPVVIVVEDVQNFSRSGVGKQLLVYTLLDLMHVKEYFFVFIAVTSNAFITSTFEKRVVSRLNAKNIFVPPLRINDLLVDLRLRLTLPDTLTDIAPTMQEVSLVSYYAPQVQPVHVVLVSVELQHLRPLLQRSVVEISRL